ncbi:hypothetical protein G6F68_016890 [Rhizopus microsporus]|nr:hypothetical protein G6F68_016890 [Rhizopus microsporus]
MRAALVAMIVGRVAVDETVGDHEVHRIAGERLGGTHVIRARRSRRMAGQQHQGNSNRQRTTHHTTSGRDGTRSTHRPATNRLQPPSTSTCIGWPPSQVRRAKPSALAATSCGITMKKLKMPMYTPIFDAGTLSDSNA